LKNIKVDPVSSIDDLSTLKQTDVLVAIDVLERISAFMIFFHNSDIVNPGGLVFAHALFQVDRDTIIVG